MTAQLLNDRSTVVKPPRTSCVDGLFPAPCGRMRRLTEAHHGPPRCSWSSRGPRHDRLRAGRGAGAARRPCRTASGESFAGPPCPSNSRIIRGGEPCCDVHAGRAAGPRVRTPRSSLRSLPTIEILPSTSGPSPITTAARTLPGGRGPPKQSESMLRAWPALPGSYSRQAEEEGRRSAWGMTSLID